MVTAFVHGTMIDGRGGLPVLDSTVLVDGNQVIAVGEHAFDSITNLIGFDDYRDFPNIRRGLVKRGYDDEQIQGILGGKFVKVFEQVCG
jgi:microsomal dipeptidase-like Zn-dependent dipeptidase